ncbi:enoyl-CoA hydratase/carnithine racemase [Candidatus Methanoperedens nitroreducens]|uniref:Enoyl-CoA hydratase/carnithine racemase n=1 Tax=Candidatus Methanoperedens nitratireducens TaxID=1392998 RepID=A0A062UX18_9EURY|nr:enoyl-CoA hydratase-related protein [Candidatus Methanoperedens nitroreducens]KCZ71536.1 enoyl-CoA hydratase/carnithine racemase [Candidatus Methanoperedens nitroreducens]MDJ1421165.1 enoyl-CoA hydratase-related protein [Candidatus Methanoperedens sp.]
MSAGNEHEHIVTERKKEIGTIILNRPEVMNILDAKTLKELGDSLTDLEKDKQIRAIIITGGKTFSAGVDIRVLKDKDPNGAEALSRLGHRIFNQIENMEKPTIAAVSGYVLGGGCEMALACDIRISGENARIGQPEVKIGIIPGFGGTQRLTRLVGIGKTKEMILTGRTVGAKEALSIGLVNMVVKDEELMDNAEKMAQVLAQKSPITIKMAKDLINKNQDIGRGLEMEINYFSECFASQDHIEGMNAFIEKRTPRFKGE